jgi:RNA polymerase sigma-70 factor (ECF subfamily)
LLAGDVTASAEIAEAFLPYIINKLQKYYPNLYDPHLAEEAADEALMHYFEQPSRYNPTLRSFDGYLIMSAKGDLLNLLRKEQNLGLSKNFKLVELDEPGREYMVDDSALTVEEQVFILASPVQPLLERLLPNHTDQKIAILMLEDVHETEEFAHALGIGHFSKEEQEAEVKRHKDRIKKILQRHIDRSELDATE